MHSVQASFFRKAAREFGPFGEAQKQTHAHVFVLHPQIIVFGPRVHELRPEELPSGLCLHQHHKDGYRGFACRATWRMQH